MHAPLFYLTLQHRRFNLVLWHFATVLLPMYLRNDRDWCFFIQTKFILYKIRYVHT